MIGARGDSPQGTGVESQTKKQARQHGNPYRACEQVREGCCPSFIANKEIAEEKIWRRKRTRGSLSKELQEVKKLARERRQAITIRIPQLKIAKIIWTRKRDQGPTRRRVSFAKAQVRSRLHPSCRDVNNQAVFCSKASRSKFVWTSSAECLQARRNVQSMQRLQIEGQLEPKACAGKVIDRYRRTGTAWHIATD